ncbi:tetratricopeptide repeat protein [Archangium violaceum]|uniref:tetratricopeptide repeat protein n=1 Tax=Archangium violaceum TaxID=83451 RepID=UPI001EF70142|nr:tetratricopeptide repeat protein [Archangium violaceum]
MRSLLIVIGVAFVIHLIPLFLPRNMPEQDLAIARAMSDAAHRVKVLKPLKENPKATGADLREAAELLREGAPLDAYELAKEAEKKEPGSVETQLVLARICHGQRMNRCEEESFARAEKLAPGDPRADLLRADFEERNGNVEGALAAVEKAYGKAPGSVGVGVRYGRLLSEAGRWDEAIQVLKRQEGALGRPQVLVEEGLVRVKQGRMEEARELFGEAVEADPKLVMGYFHLGMTAFRMGDVEGAEEALREADRLDMSDMRPLAALCEIQRQAGKTDAQRVTRMDLERRFPERMEAVRNACRAP